MKKIISLLLTFFILCSGCTTFAFIENEKNEKIAYAVNVLAERIYNKYSIKCKPVNLRQSANMAFADDVAGDGVGGWSDQGSVNDMSGFTTFGRQVYYNIPFDIIDPAKNNNKSCIVLRGQNDEHFPLSADVDINDTAYGIYILHSSPWGGNGKKNIGRYSFVYDDGSSAYFNISDSEHIFNFWKQGEGQYSRLAWTGPNNSTPTVSFTMFALNNPHPEKTIKYFRAESAGQANYICIIGATLAKEPIIFPKLETEGNEGLPKPGADSWSQYSLPDENKISGSILDASVFLDAPAGKHGLVKAKGEDFVFEDGTNAKFWGTNLVGDVCYPEHSEAQMLATTLAVSGYNLVRFSDIDNVSLTDDNLDKITYFMNELKKKGIYVYISLGAKFDPDENESTIGIVFEKDALEKKKEFVKKLFNYNDTYSNMKVSKNPQIVMVDMTDQVSMYDYIGGITCFNPTEKENVQLKEEFNKYLKDKYKTTSNLKKKWESLGKDEKLEDKTVEITAFWKQGAFDKVRKSDIIDFLAYLQSKHYKEITDVLKACGYNGLSTGFTNAWDNTYIFNSLSNSKTDFIPINAMASYGYGYMFPWHFHTKISDEMFYADADATIASDGRDGKSLINMFKNRLAGKPYVITEYGAPVINKLFEDNAILMAAVGAQQGWTPIRYCFVDNKIETQTLNKMYTTYANPVMRGMAYGIAALYYTMDELENSCVYNQNINDAKDNIDFNLKLKDFMNAKSGISLSNNKTSESKNKFDEFTISNKGIYWDMIDGSFIADTGKVIAFAGDLNERKAIGCLEFDAYSTEIVMTLASVDDKDIKESERMVLSLANDASDTGTEYQHTYIILKAGKDGVRYQSVAGEFMLKTKLDYKVFALDFEGNRIKEISTEKTKEGYTTFEVGGVGENTMNFEIIRSVENE